MRTWARAVPGESTPDVPRSAWTGSRSQLAILGTDAGRGFVPGGSLPTAAFPVRVHGWCCDNLLGRSGGYTYLITSAWRQGWAQPGVPVVSQVAPPAQAVDPQGYFNVTCQPTSGAAGYSFRAKLGQTVTTLMSHTLPKTVEEKPTE